MVIITCKIATSCQKRVSVNISDPIYILLDKLNIRDKKTKFVFNGETYLIASDLTFEEIGLTKDSVIYINNPRISGGAFTVDVSKNKTIIIPFGKSGKKYRIVWHGLNIKSECKNSSYEAYNDVIYIPIGYVVGWNLLDNLKEKVRCPSCKARVKPLNFGFWLCRYEIEYEKETEKGYDENTVKGEAGNEYKTFANEDDKVEFTRLVFNIYSN